MRVLLIFLAFWLNLHSEQIINGDIFIIKVAPKKSQLLLQITTIKKIFLLKILIKMAKQMKFY